jgi:hypothetical protein
MTMPAATWTYESGVLTHIPTNQSVTIDIAANQRLHELLSAEHWYLPPEFRDDYSQAQESDWIERDLDLSRRNEDPPVLGVEVNIGAADHEYHALVLIEDDASYGPHFQAMADALNDAITNGATKAHARTLAEEILRIFQMGDVL